MHGDGPDRTRRFPGSDGAPPRRSGGDDQTRQVGGDQTHRVGGPDQTHRVGGPDQTRRVGGPPPGPDATRRLDGDPAGQVLGGRYRLDGLLGAGGMAEVHRATDLRLGRPVAVKVFRPGTDPDGERRFSEEAQILANLRHPGLVAVHDYAVEGGHAYLVMELVQGPTLREVMDRERLGPDDIARIGVEIAGVLSYVHDQGVVHRDVKPSNVLLDRDGRVRLTDFGISRLIDATGMTAADVAVGTVAYMAPEQVQGNQVGPPADVYALGLVLLEAVTGRREYPGAGWDAAAARLEHPPAVPPNIPGHSDTPGPLPDALRAMTATDPARRPTARHAAAMLTAPLAVEPDPPRRSRTALVAGLLVALIALLAGIAWATGSDEDRGQVAAPEVTASEEPVPPSEPTPPDEPGADEPGADEPGADEPGADEPGADGPTFELPSNIPTALPDLPEIPDIPEIPEVPDSVRDAGQDARSLWDRISDWFSNLL